MSKEEHLEVHLKLCAQIFERLEAENQLEPVLEKFRELQNEDTTSESI